MNKAKKDFPDWVKKRNKTKDERGIAAIYFIDLVAKLIETEKS